MGTEMVKVAVVSKRIKKKTFDLIKRAVFYYPQTVKEAIKSSPDIIVVDDTDMPLDVGSKIKVLIVGEATKEKVFQYMNYNRFFGCIRPNISPELIDKAIQSIEKGELWVSRETISAVFEEFSKDARKMNNYPEMLKDLSRREREILNYIVQGFSNKEIAESLFISEKTVKNHLYYIYSKLGIKRRTEAITLFLLKR